MISFAVSDAPVSEKVVVSDPLKWCSVTHAPFRRLHQRAMGEVNQ